jgi:hypothetical protein
MLNRTSQDDAEQELYVYSMGRPGFILQHVVDARGVQSAEANDKRIRVVFGLVGLYLKIEKNATGNYIQRVHMELGNRRITAWPNIVFPDKRGTITAIDVMRATPGQERDKAIDEWCLNVWSAFAVNHAAIRMFVAKSGF